MNCPHCAHDNPPNSKFCLECGRSFAVRCAQCGAELPAAAKFCNECGQQLASRAAPSADRPPRDYTPKHLADKILQSKSALEGERKQVTVLFADVKGSTELATNLDPEEWHRILDRFFRILTDGVHRFEGTVNQYTGDGIMALFGAPIAHEDHAQRACYAALHLRDALHRYADQLRLEQGLDFSVRMGLNSGEVVVGKIGDDLRMDYTAQGSTVGLASRVEQLAAPGSVYLTEHTARLVEGFFQLRDVGRSKLRGAAESLRVHELKEIGPVRTRLELARSRGFSRFVGRVDEMASLELALNRATEGSGQVVGVVGEAGIGKSRLCLEFVQRCRAKQLAVHEAHCPAHGKTVPFLPILELLRDLFVIRDPDRDEEARRKIAGTLVLLDDAFQETLPLIFDFLGVAEAARPPPEIHPEARQRQLYAFVQRLIQAKSPRAPTVLLVDDLHWIDPGSDSFLAQLVEALSGTRTLLLVNFRPEYRADWMAKSYYQQLPLVPLGADAIRELLHDLLGEDASVARLSELIRERTSGNPFFIEEVVQSLIESGSLAGTRGAYRLVTPVEELIIPATVQPVLAARIDRLPPREKQVLQTASVIGKRFSEPVLRRVIELPDLDLVTSLAALQAAEFIYEEALYPVAEYAFKHPLTQEVTYQAQLSERRRRTHAAVARAIEAEEPERLDERSALLTHHCEEAGELLEAARWSRRAAEWAGFSDQTEALRHWRAVRRLAAAAPESDDSVQLTLAACVWLLRFGWRMWIPGDEASKAFEDGKRLAEQNGDLHSLARLFSEYAFFRANALETTDQILDLVDEARRLTREIGDPAFTLRVAPSWAPTYRALGRPHEALRIIEEIVQQAERDPGVGPGLVELRAYSLLLCTKNLVLLDLGRLDEVARLGEEVRQRAQEHGWDEILYWATEALAARAFFAGDAEGALRHARDGAELAEKIGARHAQGGSCHSLGRAHILAGRWSEAREALERSAEIGGSNFWTLLRRTELADAYLVAGDHEKARATIDGVLSVTRGRHIMAEAIASLGLARILLGTEGLDAADRIEEALLDAWQISEELGSKLLLPHVRLERSQLAHRRGDEAARRRELRSAYQLFIETGATGHAQRLAAELGL